MANRKYTLAANNTACPLFKTVLEPKYQHAKKLNKSIFKLQHKDTIVALANT